MSKPYSFTDSATLENQPGTASGEAVNYRQLLEQLNQHLPFAEAAVVTSLPRGSLQVAHPRNIADALLKSYLKEYNLHDRPAWEAIMRKQAVAAEQCWPQGRFETSPYYTGFLRGNGL